MPPKAVNEKKAVAPVAKLTKIETKATKSDPQAKSPVRSKSPAAKNKIEESKVAPQKGKSKLD